jgi:uncharacterized NAD-dependent epimerase/dehydratase family protein
MERIKTMNTAAESHSFRSLFVSSRRKLRAVLYAEGGIDDELGKTAHGIIRFSARYEPVAILDSSYRARGGVLFMGVPVFSSLAEVVSWSFDPEVFVVGVAPTGLGDVEELVDAAMVALKAGLSVHSGLHIFLSDIPALASAAIAYGVNIVDVRRPPQRALRMYTGDIVQASAPRVLVTGQDAAVGKRTAALRIAMALAEQCRCCLIGTGQTAWFQGFRYGITLDSIPMDFAAGELEGEILRASTLENPEVIIIEGQGSLLNPAYSPETCVLLTATQPSAIIYVKAPGRTHYIDFPRHEISCSEEEIELIERISGARVVGIVINNAVGLRESLDFDTRRPTIVGVDSDVAPLAAALLEVLDIS